MQWCSCDFSAQEPRLTVHFAKLLHAPGADVIVQKYIENPNLDLYILLAEIIAGPAAWARFSSSEKKLRRNQTKAILLGLSYGMGVAKLCRSLNMTEAQGRVTLNRFHQLVPFIKFTDRACQNHAQWHGYIRTLLGRKCRFPFKPGCRERDWVYKALNRLIQGSGADQTKQAMLDMDAAGHFLQLSVHDEVTASVSGPEEAEKIRRIMEQAVQLEVPSIAEVSIGETWGSVK
jgi:DNA polymerase I-like protein with 3'-5' exonuclease and polymerase domains